MPLYTFETLPNTTSPEGVRVTYRASTTALNIYNYEFGLRQLRAHYNSDESTDEDLFLFYIYDPMLTFGVIDCSADNDNNVITINGVKANGASVTAAQVAALLRTAKVI
jgi:hypothetical protein